MLTRFQGRKQCVLITRSPKGAEDFIRALADLAPEAEVGCVPIRQAIFCAPEAGLVERLAAGEFDWVTVTSRNGAIALAHWAQLSQLTPAQLLATARLACVGRASAALLHELGVSVDFVPDIQDAAHMVTGWPGQPGQSVLCLQGSSARTTLACGLEERGQRVHVVTLYDMVPYPAPVPLLPENTEGALTLSRAQQLLQQVAVVVATAPSLLINLLGTQVLQGQSPARGQESSRLCVVAIGATTAATATELGFETVQAKSPAPEDLAAATAAVLKLDVQEN